MSEQKRGWTEGPYEVKEVVEGHYEIHSPLNGRTRPVPVAVVDYSRDGHEHTRVVKSRANADLLAAAPEMYEALVEARYTLIKRALQESTTFGIIEAALSKALGEQNGAEDGTMER